MNNAEKFQEVFGYYATEMWAKTEAEFLDWINEEHNERTGWIPVSEKMPEELEEVLVCVTHNGKSKMAVSCRRDYNYWDSWGRDIIGEMAWIPLPEPYKGGDTE